MVKCADCGFLTVKNMNTREFEEVDEKYRETGRREKGPIDGTYRWEHEPMCFVQAVDLRKEVKRDRPEAGPDIEEIAKLLDTPRLCKDWCQWCQGFTPKEHEEQRRRDRERKSDRRWRWINLGVSSAVSLVTTLLSIGAGALIYWLSTRGGSQ